MALDGAGPPAGSPKDKARASGGTPCRVAWRSTTPTWRALGAATCPERISDSFVLRLSSMYRRYGVVAHLALPKRFCRIRNGCARAGEPSAGMGTGRKRNGSQRQGSGAEKGTETGRGTGGSRRPDGRRVPRLQMPFRPPDPARPAGEGLSREIFVKQNLFYIVLYFCTVTI